MAIDKKPTSNLKGVEGAAVKALAELEREGGKIQVVGTIENGKIMIDQASLDEIARKFPDSRLSFVAVNAPFDPVSPN